MTLDDRIARHPIGLGTAPLGSRADGPLWWGPQDRDEAVLTVCAAIDAGASFIDTAPFYGWGLAEQIVGEAIADRSDTPPILTKCGVVPLDDGSAADDASPTSIRRGIESSLENLGRDRIDVVQVHDPDPATPIEDTWEELHAAVDEGLIGGAGLSNHPIDLMERALAVGPIAVVQHQSSALFRRTVRSGIVDWCREGGIPFLSWAPLASGFLADDFDLAELHPDDLRHRLPWAGDRVDVTRRVRATVQRMADDLGTDLTRASLAVAAHGDGVAAIVGSRSVVEATELGRPIPELSTEQIAAIDEAAG
ncbi:MAG: aldo/keto reductase [Actinomycetota bacterium]